MIKLGHRWQWKTNPDETYKNNFITEISDIRGISSDTFTRNIIKVNSGSRKVGDIICETIDQFFKFNFTRGHWKVLRGQEKEKE